MVDAGQPVVDAEGCALEGGEELRDGGVGGWGEDDGAWVGVWHFALVFGGDGNRGLRRGEERVLVKIVMRVSVEVEV